MKGAGKDGGNIQDGDEKQDLMRKDEVGVRGKIKVWAVLKRDKDSAEIRKGREIKGRRAQ